MSAFAWLRLAHVLSAVLGAGSVGAVAISAHAASRAGSLRATPIVPLLRLTSIGFAATLLTGGALDFATGGAFHEHWWFRLAGLSLIVAGALLGVLRRRARRALAGDRETSLAGLAGLAYGASALVAWITVLMELRPFR
jgi:hypothetical protein